MPEQVPRPQTVADEITVLCASTDAVDAYLMKHGTKIQAAAVAITKQCFGHYDGRIADEISSRAMELLFRAVTDKTLASKITRAPSVLTWLNGVLRVMALNLRKSQVLAKPHVQIDERLFEEANVYAQDIQNHIDRPEIQRMIRECLKTLSDSEARVWEVIINHHGDRPTSREIATTLGMSAGSVDVHLSHGRQRLMECLKKKGVTP